MGSLSRPVANTSLSDCSPISASGHKQTDAVQIGMFALAMCDATRNVGYGPKRTFSSTLESRNARMKTQFSVWIDLREYAGGARMVSRVATRGRSCPAYL